MARPQTRSPALEGELLEPEGRFSALVANRPGAAQPLPLDAQEKRDRILAGGLAPNTAKAYRADLAYFSAWAGLAVSLPADALPVPVAVVVQFIAEHLEGLPSLIDAQLVAQGIKAQPGPHRLATVERRVAVLSKAHQVAVMVARRAGEGRPVPNPCADPEVRELLSRARRRAAREGLPQRKKRAATRDILDAMLATCGDDLAGVRDRALLLFAAASGGRRRSEVAAALVEDLTPAGENLVFRLRYSKTDQAGEGTEVPVRGRAAAALWRWLEVAGISSGPLFRRVDRHGNVGGALAGQAVWSIVRKRAALAGLDPSAFGGHSLRSGFLTEAGRSGKTLADAMALSGHRSVAVALSYHQAGAALHNPAGETFE